MAAGRKTGGRQKGTPNKVTGTLREAVLLAADNADGPEKLVGYLRHQATANPVAFMSLLGRILPMQVAANLKSGAFAEVVVAVDEMRRLKTGGSSPTLPTA